jgi:hypothetical protein
LASSILKLCSFWSQSELFICKIISYCQHCLEGIFSVFNQTDISKAPYSPLLSKRCSYWSACVSNSAAIGPLLMQERLANQEEENAALQRMLEEQQHVIKLALARILPAKKQDTYFCEVGQQISPTA